MNPAEYHKMRKMEDRLWWFCGRRRIVLRQFQNALLKSTFKTSDLRIADIGCGTGRLLRDLGKFGNVTGFDLSPVALDICEQRSDQQTKVVRADATRLPVKECAFDCLTALDLLEHIPDDNRALADFFRILKPGGFAIFTVPAHPNLWGAHDVALHHCRRYQAQTWLTQLRNSGFQVDFFSHAMGIAYPAAFFWRKFKSKLPSDNDHTNVQTDDFLPPALINQALYFSLCAESAWLGNGWRMPFGLSLIAVVRRPLP